VKSAPYLSALTFLLALQAGALSSPAAVFPTVEPLVQTPAWSPKIKPGSKPAPGGEKCPQPPYQPCYPNPRPCRGGF
jgi:hypothetical protein